MYLKQTQQDIFIILTQFFFFSFRQIDTSYPRTIANWWLGCPDKEEINFLAGNATEEPGQTVSQSESEAQKAVISGQTHNEGDSKTEQFLPVDNSGRAGTMDFFHGDTNSVQKVKINFILTILTSTFIIIFLFCQKS